MENDEKLTENLIDGLSEAQLQRLADRIKEIPQRPIRPPIPPVIDKRQEAKSQMDLYYRQRLKRILKNLYSFTPMMSPNQLAFVRLIKNKFVQNRELASTDELKQLNGILKSVRGYC